MTVRIYNDATATFPDQAEPDEQDFVILSGLSGVLSGCAVTANSSNMTLTVASGIAVVNGQPTAVAGGSAVIGVASANPRWDVVVVNSSGAQSVLTGTPTATNAVMPSVDPTLFAALVAVFIPVATSALTPGHLVDKTKPIPSSFERILATTGTTFLRSKVSGDTTDRLKITADGKFVWTPGNSATPAPQLAYDATLAGLLATGKLGATALAPTETPLTVTAAGSQSADIFTVRSSAPAVLVKVDASGQFSAQNFKRGTGAPNTVVNGNVGDVYQQLDGAPGATLWIKETGSGNTGWNASGTTSAGLVLGGGQIPTGGILEWSHSVLPGGYLWCDGSAVSRATFSALNALYSTDGYPYGAGNGSTTFNLPDKRGIITAGSQSFGVNGVVGVADRQIGTTIGGTVGNRNKSLIIAEMPFHDHPGTQDAGHAHASNKRPNTGTVPITPGAGPQEVETVLGASGFGVTGINFASITTGGQGSAQAFSLLQPTVLSRFIVKY